jgi:hypothetical protein
MITESIKDKKKINYLLCKFQFNTGLRISNVIYELYRLFFAAGEKNISFETEKVLTNL